LTLLKFDVFRNTRTRANRLEAANVAKIQNICEHISKVVGTPKAKWLGQDLRDTVSANPKT